MEHLDWGGGDNLMKEKKKKKINKKNKNNMYKFDRISVGPLECYATCLFNFMLP